VSSRAGTGTGETTFDRAYRQAREKLGYFETPYYYTTRKKDGTVVALRKGQLSLAERVLHSDVRQSGVRIPVSVSLLM